MLQSSIIPKKTSNFKNKILNLKIIRQGLKQQLCETYQLINYKRRPKMRHKKLKLTIILLLGIGLTGLLAQNKLYVKERTGMQTTFALNNIQKIFFTESNMNVNRTDGNKSTYVLSDIRYLNFMDLTTHVSQIGRQENRSFILYPIPVINKLQISYESLKAGSAQIEIIDVQGKVLHRQTISSQNGTNQAVITVAQLRGGLYICRLQNGDKLETIKFIKN